jgi:hypothetical protein
MISNSIPDGVKPLYFLHSNGSDTSILADSMVLSWDSLCPPFTSAPHCKIFQSHFCVKFFVDGKQFVHQFSPFEYTSCYCFPDSLHYCLFHWDNWYALNCGILAITSLWILDSLHDCLCQIRDSNLEIFQPDQFAAPAAHISKLLSMGLLVQGCPNMPNGFVP